MQRIRVEFLFVILAFSWLLGCKKTEKISTFDTNSKTPIKQENNSSVIVQPPEIKIKEGNSVPNRTIINNEQAPLNTGARPKK